MAEKTQPKVRYEDVVFAQAQDQQLLARCYRSELSIGHGIVMVHGGAWTANDRTTPWFVSESLARKGLTVLSLDFRCGPNFTHPSASCDVVAGVRFLRYHAKEFGVSSESIGLIGSSSGGHLALFAGLNSHREDHQMTQIRVEDTEFEDGRDISANPAYIVALWPVSDPEYRYLFAQSTGRDDLVRAHKGYFGSFEQMEDASVQRTLRSGEAIQPPPTMVVQPGNDANVPEELTMDLIQALQERNTEVTYRYMANLPHAFAYRPSSDAHRCCEYIWTFVRDQLKVSERST